MASASTPDAGFWPAIAARRKLTPDEAKRFRAAARRLAALTSPAMADWLLSSPVDADGPLIPSEDIHRSRLLARFTRSQGLHWLNVLAEAGVEVVCLKGTAAGSLLYPDADLRPLSDVDLLVRARDLKKLIETLSVKGFIFAKARGTPRWGHIGDASFHPFVAPNGAFSFDLHVQPDDYPVHRGLPAEDVFIASQIAMIDGVRVRIPSARHFLLLALTNAARDKLGPEAMKSIADAIVFLCRSDLDPGWPAILAAAEKGRFLRTIRGVVAFLKALGVPAERLPHNMGALSAMARGEVAQAVADVADGFSVESSKLALQRREFFLLAPWHVIRWRYERRVRGLLKPWPGVPAV
jgi:hypothetical protein